MYAIVVVAASKVDVVAAVDVDVTNGSYSYSSPYLRSPNRRS